MYSPVQLRVTNGVEDEPASSLAQVQETEVIRAKNGDRFTYAPLNRREVNLTPFSQS